MSAEANTSPAAQPHRLTYDRQGLAEALGISERTLDRLRQRRDFPKAIRNGRRGKPLWSIDAVRRWLDGGSA